MTLTEFLLARIAEDESVARTVEGGVFSHPMVHAGDPYDWPTWQVQGTKRGSEAMVLTYSRMLAECEAKRRIVNEVARKGPGWDPPEDWYDEADDTEPILRFLALPYTNHPDYEQEWAA